MSILNKNELNELTKRDNIKLNLDQFKKAIYDIASDGYTSVYIDYLSTSVFKYEKGDVFKEKENKLSIYIGNCVTPKAKLCIYRTIDKICKEENIYFKDDIIDWSKDYE